MKKLLIVILFFLIIYFLSPRVVIYADDISHRIWFIPPTVMVFWGGIFRLSLNPFIHLAIDLVVMVTFTAVVSIVFFVTKEKFNFTKSLFLTLMSYFVCFCVYLAIAFVIDTLLIKVLPNSLFLGSGML